MNKRKSILITGATSGVGLVLAKRIVTSDVELWVTGRNTKILDALQSEGAHAIPADLSKTEDINRLVHDNSSFDIVIFCAGLGTFEYAHDIDDEMIERMIDVNVIAPMKLTKRLLPAMLQRKSGHLIYLGSQAGKVATPKASIYAASKHALLGYTDALRMELAPYGIFVTTINPGPIDTPFLDFADHSGAYRNSLGKHLLHVDTVVDAIYNVIDKPVRQIDLPWYMAITSKLHAVAPSLIERLGKRYFMKK